MGDTIVEKVVTGVLNRPDIPITILILILVIAGLFYLLIRSYKQTDKITEHLENTNKLMATLIQLTNTDHEATITNRDILQRFDVCLGNFNLQLSTISQELRSHRDESNRKYSELIKN